MLYSYEQIIPAKSKSRSLEDAIVVLLSVHSLTYDHMIKIFLWLAANRFVSTNQ